MVRKRRLLSAGSGLILILIADFNFTTQEITMVNQLLERLGVSASAYQSGNHAVTPPSMAARSAA